MHPQPQPQQQKQKQTQQKQKQQEEPEDQNDDDQSIFGAMSAVFPLSIASWTKDAFSIGGGMSVASNRGDKDDNVSVASKPIQYIHQPEDDNSVGSRARSVSFKDERSISGRALDATKKHTKPPRIMHSSQINYPRRPKRAMPTNGRPPAPTGNPNNPMAPISSVHLNDHSDGLISIITTDGMNSIMEDAPLSIGDFSHSSLGKQGLSQDLKAAAQAPSPGMVDYRRVKKQSHRPNLTGKAEDPSNSMLSAVANQIVMGMGSWDAGTVAACGTEGPPSIGMDGETMAVEIEGQEVQLVDMMDSQPDIPGDNSVIEDRMPPHSKEQLQVGWPSRVGSCGSFFSDSLAGASLFGGKGEDLSAASSMDMDVSSNTDPYSCAGSVGAGSIGGASLCRVFDADSVAPEGTMNAMPSPNSRMLKQLPSWERSLRSKSPASVGSHDDAEEDSFSFVTRGSEKLMGGSISTMGSGEHNERSGSMTWENHKKE